jgi:hypothetical protein
VAISFGLLVKDEYSGYLWSFFLRYCNDLNFKLLAFVKMFPRVYRCFCCDNYWENRNLQEALTTEVPFQVRFEYTAPNPLQQNGRIERKFATLYGKIFALMTASRLSQTLQNNLWPNAAKLVTHLENTIFDTNNSIPHIKLKGKSASWAKNLRIIGEIGIFSTEQRISNKLVNHGEPYMFLGHPEDHTSNFFKFYNPHTQACLLSRNFYWLNKSYGDYCNVPPDTINA